MCLYAPINGFSLTINFGMIGGHALLSNQLLVEIVIEVGVRVCNDRLLHTMEFEDII